MRIDSRPIIPALPVGGCTPFVVPRHVSSVVSTSPILVWIHIPLAGRRNPISERLLVLANDALAPQQPASHQVTILRSNGTSAADSPSAIRLLCRPVGQFGQQKARVSVSRASRHVDAGHTENRIERFEIRLPPIAEEPRLHRCGCAYSRARNRGEHGGLFCAERALASRVAVP